MTLASEESHLPETMTAAVIDRFGDPEEVVHTARIQVPRTDPGDVLIRVACAGVGVWDPDICKGDLGAPPGGFPYVLGSDGAGTVARAGRDVERFQGAERVYAWSFLNPKGGFFAEYVAVPEDDVSPIPEGLSDAEAGVLAIDGLTALAGLDKLSIGKDSTLMIIGASGGVGHLAVQLAKRLGARVFAVASGADGVELASRLGADGCVDGRSDRAIDEARAFAPDGYDAGLALASGRSADRLLDLVRDGGRIAFPHGVNAPSGRAGIAIEAYDGYRGHEAFERLNRLVAMGPFHVEVSRLYPLDGAPQALHDVTGHHLGKFALQVQDHGTLS